VRWSGAWFVRTGRERLDCKSHLWRERNKHTRRCVEPTRVQETSRRTGPRQKARHTPDRTRASNDLVRGSALESSTWSREGEEAMRATLPRHRRFVDRRSSRTSRRARARESVSVRERERGRKSVCERSRERVETTLVRVDKNSGQVFLEAEFETKDAKQFCKMEKRKSTAGQFCFVVVDVPVVRAIGSVVGSRLHLDRADRRQVLRCIRCMRSSKAGASLDDATIALRETRHGRWKRDLCRGN